jgi:trypsin
LTLHHHPCPKAEFLRFTALLAVLAALLVVPAGPARAIVGGTVAAPGSHPYILSVQLNGQHVCGAALLSPTTAVTAAHCYAENPRNTSISAGRQNITVAETSAQTRKVSSYVIHPRFDAVTVDSDIAVLHWKEPLALNSRVGVVPYAPQGSGPPVGSSMDIAGWGVLNEDSREPSAELRRLDVPVLSDTACARRYYPGADTSTKFCAGFAGGGEDACYGDSGGPGVVDGRLVGIISYGDGCARPNRPGVYTRVAAFADWVGANTT